MVGKGLRFLVPAALALLVAGQWRDIIRYVKISQLSTGQGHPENVPARGRASYPQRPGSGEADGPRRLRLSQPGRSAPRAVTAVPVTRGHTGGVSGRVWRAAGRYHGAGNK